MAPDDRLHALDAVRGFALIGGVVLHAAMSYLPGFGAVGWPIADNSPSVALGVLFFVIHMFRMTTFFVIAGFFGRMLLERDGVRAFVRNRSTRVVVPLVVGWIVLFPLIIAAMAWGATSSRAGALTSPPTSGTPFLAFPLTHLWFLYVLILMYALALIVRWCMTRFLDRNGHLPARIDAWLRLAVRGAVAPVLLALPLTAALSLAPMWVKWMGIPTPDQSLVPNLPALIGFTTSFGVGWLLHRQVALFEVWAARWLVHLALAVALTVACLWQAGLTPSVTFAVPGWPTSIYAFCYALAVWTWTFAIIGIALRFFSAASAVRRYIADASYWVYLVHLPLVFFLQAAMKDLPWHWSVKFPVLLAVALALLFGSYHLVVRFTFIGEVLNGRRRRRTTMANVSAAVAVGPASGVMAELSSARKRYGNTVALDGLDLQVRQGELLALLGPNGAGKSTAISLLLGLQQAETGSASLLGQSPDRVEARYHVGVMMQEVVLAPELRVRELIALTMSYYPAPFNLDEVLELTHTAPLADRPYGKLSAGQKRQAQFALAICGRPSLLFLDEPTVGLDIQAREMLWATIRRLISQGCSIVLTTHYLEEAEALADRVVVLAKGRLIASGTVNEIRGLVVRMHITCATTLAADQVATWSGVGSVTRDRERLRIVATDAEAVVRRLMIEDDGVRDLEVLRAGLAEAFTELTQEAA
jgi:ABC-type multidrug transport system ATPase subunit/peptidoglycan/LPS O-acetylase OafA/YrhL